MIHVTGDTHADFRFRFNTENFPEQKESKNERWWLDWFESRPFTTLFIDGNHENHERLAAYPMM